MERLDKPKRVVKFSNDLPEVTKNVIEGKHFYACGPRGVHVIDISTNEMTQKCFRVYDHFDRQT